MSAFLDAALGFPAVVFTILLLPVVLYWLLVMVGMVDLDFGDADLDFDVDADAEADGDTGESGDGQGLLAEWWQALGLASMPITVSVSLIVVFGWFAALVVTGLINSLDWGSALRLVVGVGVLGVAFCFGAVVAAIAGRPLGRLFETTYAETRSDFVGRTCVIKTTVVTDAMGQAEAADPTGATVLLPVRPVPEARKPDPPGAVASEDSPAELRYGTTALIVEYDRQAEVFLVTALDEDLQEAFGDGAPDGI
jgi:hypothetical protein